MKTMIIVFFVFCTMLSCSTLPPPKKFTTTTYLSLDISCLYQWISETENIQLCPGDVGYPDPNELVVIKLEDLKKEIDYQNELIKSCKMWR